MHLTWRFILITTILSLYDIAQAQPDINEIDSYIAQSRIDWNIPGMAIAIVKDGEVILSKGYGIKQAGENQPVDDQTLFAIASNTKAFVASSLADLVAKGVISWNDKVTDYIPYLELYDPYVTEEIRIKDLLSHRSGLGTFSGDLTWYKSDLSTEEIIKKIKYVPQAYGFRNGYGYSNLMFIVAGEVIRSATGKGWNEYVSESFFEPLGMERSITSTDQLPEKGNFAMPHKPYENGAVEVINWVNWDQMGAAGGIISSVSDMAKWMQMHLNGGTWSGDTLLDKAQQNILWTPHNNHIVTDRRKEIRPGTHFSSYGLGWGLSDYYGNLIVTHSGGYDGMYSRVMLVPDQNLGIVVLTNSMKGVSDPLCYYIVNQFIGKDMRNWSMEALEVSKANNSQNGEERETVEKRRKKNKPIYKNAAYTGMYESGMHGRVFITEKEEKLRLIFEDNPGLSATLKHWHYNVWEIEWDQPHAWFDFGTIQFLLDNNLKVNGMHIDVPNYDIFFDEVDLIKIK